MLRIIYITAILSLISGCGPPGKKYGAKERYARAALVSQRLQRADQVALDAYLESVTMAYYGRGYTRSAERLRNSRNRAEAIFTEGEKQRKLLNDNGDLATFRRLFLVRRPILADTLFSCLEALLFRRKRAQRDKRLRENFARWKAGIRRRLDEIHNFAEKGLRAEADRALNEYLLQSGSLVCDALRSEFYRPMSCTFGYRTGGVYWCNGFRVFTQNRTVPLGGEAAYVIADLGMPGRRAVASDTVSIVCSGKGGRVFFRAAQAPCDSLFALVERRGYLFEIPVAPGNLVHTDAGLKLPCRCETAVKLKSAYHGGWRTRSMATADTLRVLPQSFNF